jgi:hypothetical protein
MPKQNSAAAFPKHGATVAFEYPKMPHYATSPVTHWFCRPSNRPGPERRTGSKLRALFLSQLGYNVLAFTLVARLNATKFYLIQVPKV